MKGLLEFLGMIFIGVLIFILFVSIIFNIEFRGFINEAIKVGAGEYYVDEYNQRQWRWK